MPLPIPEPRVLELQRIVTRTISTTATQDSTVRDKERSQQTSKTGTRKRHLANWDPSYPSENVDWYDEYIARHGPLSISWLQQPANELEKSKDKREVRGLGFKSNGDRNIVIAPLDDNSVCVWDLGRNDDVHDARSGRILARSKRGILMADASRGDFGNDPASPTAKATNPGVIECVSVDQVRNKAYFAVHNGLNEVDLETLQVISHENYGTTISALSDVSHPTPLTVGTGFRIHLHDPRRPHNAPSVQESDWLDIVTTLPILPTTSFQTWVDSSRSKGTVGRGSSGPLSILHQPLPDGTTDAINGDIYVAGRFPSILVYDRRKSVVKPHNTIYSGARLSALAPLAPISNLSTPQALLAAGEYNGKGSLELHSLPTSSDSIKSLTSEFKNRTSASSSKLLSVISQGTRLLFSDSNGMLKWVERDGFTLVQRWNINQPQIDAQQPPPPRRRGLFPDGSAPVMENGGDVARKILGTGLGAKDGILVWTGERVGVVEFRKNTRIGLKDEEEGEMSIEDKERFLYGETMRRALERQADEVRFVRGLGLGR